MAEVPSDASRVRVIALVVVSVVVVVGVVSAALWWAFSPREGDGGERRFEPAAETSASVPATAVAQEATAKAQPPAVQVEASPVYGPRVAYRIDDRIWVTDGTDAEPLPVARSKDGQYALSPDGTRVALAEDGALLIVDVATGKKVRVGDASMHAPIWSTDSRELYYVRGDGAGAVVRRVAADGRGDAPIHDGSEIAVSDKVIAVGYGETDSSLGPSRVALSTDGRTFAPVAVTGYVTGLAVTDTWLIVGTSKAGAPSILAYPVAGGRPTSLLGGSATEPPADWTQFCVSPDSRYLAVAATGDDGYSRVSIVPLGGGAVVAVPSRRDTYVNAWSADSQRLWYFEGNAMQGEDSALMRVSADGTLRQSVVQGAQR